MDNQDHTNAGTDTVSSPFQTLSVGEWEERAKREAHIMSREDKRLRREQWRGNQQKHAAVR